MRTRLAGGIFAVICCVTLVWLGRGLFQGQRAGPGAGQSAAPAPGPPGNVLSSPAHAAARTFPPSQEELWSRPVTEQSFAQFVDWTRRHAAAPTPAAKLALESEGETLARARLIALADMIQSHPERALELAVPHSVRGPLPDSVRALIETPVNTIGDYTVVCVTPAPGQKSTVPFIRSANIQGVDHQIFTHGPGLDYVTRQKVPLNGISVPVTAAALPPADPISLKPAHLMALSPSPARLLDASERAERAPGAAVAVEWAGEVQAFATLAAAQIWAASETDDANLDSPQIPANLPTAESTYTEGRKRYLLMRVDFPDYTTDVFPTNNALQHMTDMSNFLAQISYYKHIIAPVGKGSDITPVMRMGENTAAYDNAGLSKLYPEARTAAQNVHGYDLSQYDFFFVCTGGRPSYSYAGLGYVGGVGYHLANSYFDVRTSAHELGHNLGLGHADWLETGGDSIIGAGSNEEYGDPFDTMGGSGGGNRHFSASQKNRLDWIPAGAAPTVTASGVFRLHAHDFATAPIGLRALRFNRASGDPYWAEFRQLWTGNKAMMNGINIRRAAGGSQLLDMTPGSSGGKDNHSLVIGRTFSDTSLGLHITPVGKGHTYPESVDVVVNIGTFSANLPPACVVNAGPLIASVGQTISFTATATDPNGDTLAYAWNFDDNDYSIDNSAVTTHAFTTAGEYTVSCAVSDMKGGVGRDSVVVRVGNPSTFRISGRVFNAQNRPLAGIRVSADATHYAFTDSDGAYTITALGAGSYTLDAKETVTDTTQFIHPFFNNPVTVGPSATSRDFIVGTPPTPISLVAAGSTWKYLDNGTDQGTAWTATNFNDAAWVTGTAQLGYGEGDEATVVSYGPNASAKYTTTYFRRAFTVANPTLYSNLFVNVLRDDGVIVYLNGTEVFRNNMPAGAVTYATFASTGDDVMTYFTGPVSASLLRAGSNVFAVELHQADLTTSDASFDLSLTEEVPAQGYFVYLTAPEPGAVVTGPTNLTLAATALLTPGSFTNVEFFDGASKLGEDNAAPYSFVLINPSSGVHALSAVAVTSGGIRRTSAPVAITVIQPVALALVPAGSTWRYMAGASAQPAAWPTLAFNDSVWPAGPAELGFGDGGEATVLNGGPGASRYPTIYFRHAFTVNDPGAITNLALQLKRDDGAVVYLNGVEVLRNNMTNGAIAYATLAAAGADDDGATFLDFTLDPSVLPSLLRAGTNVIAAEVHQSDLTSSDLSFDLSLTAFATTNRARGCWLVAPAAGSTFALPGSLALTAQAVAGDTLGVARIDYYSGGSLLGGSANPPFTFSWSSPPGGARVLTAVATDSAGASITSAPVNVTVLAPPLGTALISLGDAWNYMDDGSNQGTNWTGRLFNDAAWATGPAVLGYGGNGEVTTVSYGNNAAVKHATTYFRRRFTVANPAALNGLALRLLRDDGAVVYLNGVEKYRNNLEDGLVSWNSLAVAAIDSTAETTPLDVLLTTAGLVTGTNVLAVEIHQASVGSSDLSFDLMLSGLTSTNPASGVYLASPPNGARYTSPASVALSAFATAPAPVTLVEYFAGASKVAQSAAHPYAATWVNPAVGVHALTARATYGAGLVLTSPPISIVVSPAPQPSQPVFLTLIPPGAGGWKYWDSASAPGAGWQSPSFSDTSWSNGIARFGWGLDGEATALTEGRITHYFRRWFNVANGGQLEELLVQLVRDDGAVVYLNGAEIFRSNMPAGPVDAATLAAAGVNTPDETTWYSTVLATAGSSLTGGSNLVAVELHQSSAASSDASFDFALYGQGTTGRRIYLPNPTNNSSFVNISGVPMEAFASAGNGLSVAKIEFFADGIEIGESTTPAYKSIWLGAAIGPRVLRARLTDNLGGTLDSAPVTVNVTRELITTTFIPSNSVWKYFDGGVSQGTNWTGLNFNDSTWPQGPARLGFGGDGEVTLINGGPSNARFPTVYFRKAFVVPSGAIYTNLLFKLARDDGTVIHLNGREAYRDNMPATAITYASYASGGTSDEQSYFPTNIAVTNLSAGTNILAVELHQSNATSGDLGFNLELTASGFIDESIRPAVAIEMMDGLIEISWSTTYSTWRLYSSTDMLLPIAQWTPVAAMPVTAGSRIVVSVPPAGFTRFFRLGRP